MRHRRWRIALIVVVVLAAGALSVRLGLLDWLVASDGVVRNVMEGLSWPASVLALLLAGAPYVRRLLPSRASLPRGGSQVNPLLGRALHLVNGALPAVNQ